MSRLLIPSSSARFGCRPKSKKKKKIEEPPPTPRRLTSFFASPLHTRGTAQLFSFLDPFVCLLVSLLEDGNGPIKKKNGAEISIGRKGKQEGAKEYILYILKKKKRRKKSKRKNGRTEEEAKKERKRGGRNRVKMEWEDASAGTFQFHFALLFFVWELVERRRDGRNAHILRNSPLHSPTFLAISSSFSRFVQRGNVFYGQRIVMRE